VNPVVFLALALLTVVAALTVILHRNPVHSALALVVTLFLLSVLFLGLGAELIAALQVVVYAGAIVVLFLFVIMLLNLQVEVRAVGAPMLVATATAGGLVLAAFVAAGLRRAGGADGAGLPADFGRTAALAERLFTAYLVPFELASLLLLVAIVGAVALARRGG
jgi:NADH-quinone oxidoreductase subunit J